MADKDVGQITTTDLTNQVADFSVDPTQTDAAQEQKETEYMNTNWSQQLGYYKDKKSPKITAQINALARWTIGKGFKSNEITTMLLMSIKGNGVDTFNTILENQVRVTKIGGDSYAEIIRDKDDVLINLKPLDPGVIKIIANRKGIIIKYHLMSKTGTPKTTVKKFNPEDIFHLSRNRTADEIHGISLIDEVQERIDMRNELLEDWRTVLHRNVVPVRIIEIDSDNPTKIAKVKAEYATAIKNKEVIVIPMGTVKFAQDTIAPNATMNPLPTIDMLNDEIAQVSGVPQIITGGSKEFTEASAKIIYLAWQQTVEEEQLYTEEQVLAQLNLEIELEFPASLENEMLSDRKKEETTQAATPEDVGVNQ